MLCTGTKQGQFFWGLGSVACPCNRKFCVAIADVRKRTFHCAPCDPRVECMRVRVRRKQVFHLNNFTLQLCYYKAKVEVDERKRDGQGRAVRQMPRAPSGSG